MNLDDLKNRYRAAIYRIISKALPGERPVVLTNAHVIPGMQPDPRPRVAMQFVASLESDEAGSESYNIVSTDAWYLKPDELVTYAEQLAESEPMQKKLVDALAGLPPDRKPLGRVVDFIYSELIAKEGGYGAF